MVLRTAIGVEGVALAVLAGLDGSPVWLGTVGLALGALLALPVLGMIGPLHAWLPSTLVTAPIALLGGSTPGDYLPALAIAAVSTPLLLAAATFQLDRRDV